MATRMKLKLKTVFVLYFMVSLLGLVYALMQLGKWTRPDPLVVEEKLCP